MESNHEHSSFHVNDDFTFQAHDQRVIQAHFFYKINSINLQIWALTQVFLHILNIEQLVINYLWCVSFSELFFPLVSQPICLALVWVDSWIIVFKAANLELECWFQKAILSNRIEWADVIVVLASHS